jgi:hypothetical protein
VNPLWDSRDFALGPLVRGTTSLWPLCRGTKILLDYFVDEALIAQFSRDFKERCAVYAKYFCEAVPFWEKGGGEVFAGMKSKDEPFLYEPQKRFGTHAGLNCACDK